MRRRRGTGPHERSPWATGGLASRWVGASGLVGLLPGEGMAALPGFAAYAVAVRDVAATERFLREAGVPVRESSAGEVFVPAPEALGVAIIFRQAG
ncbi:hypothetical protein [Nonomuraea polychroma]|uniref:hypothetical protein n=1 Tax=Nonomuraea polychroma TaxID=46176 RepID=UPI0019D4303E|nr:hypothetical protein [Nonomuraea polychroma]